MGCSIVNQPFWGTPFLGTPHINCICGCRSHLNLQTYFKTMAGDHPTPCDEDLCASSQPEGPTRSAHKHRPRARALTLVDQLRNRTALGGTEPAEAVQFLFTSINSWTYAPLPHIRYSISTGNLSYYPNLRFSDRLFPLNLFRD